MRMYVASMAAYSAVIDPDNEKQDTFSQHAPALIPATDMKAAAQEAGRIILKHFPKDEGWYGHSAILTTVTKAFFESLKPWLDQGVVPDTGDPEPTEKFTFID